MFRIRLYSLAAALAVGIGSGSALSEEGDAAAGEKVFNKCKACHSAEAGKSKVGPSLFGVVGRAAGSAEEYGRKYSDGIKEAAEKGLVWDEETIFEYLADPKEFLSSYLEKDRVKNKMTFKLRKEGDRRDVIAYLKTLN